MFAFLIALAFAAPPGAPPANWPATDYAVPTGLIQLWKFDPEDTMQHGAVCSACLASIDDTCWTEHSANSLEQVGSIQLMIDHRFDHDIFKLPESFDVGTLNGDGNEFCVYGDVANMDTSGLKFFFYYTRTQSDFAVEECDLSRPIMDGNAYAFHTLTESVCTENYLIQLPDLSQETTPGCTVEYDFDTTACGEHNNESTFSMPLAKCMAKAEYRDFLTDDKWGYSSTKIDGDIANGLIRLEWENVMDCSGGSWIMGGCAIPDGICQEKYVGISRYDGELSTWAQRTVTISDPRNCVAANADLLNGNDWCNGYECELGPELDIQTECRRCGQEVRQEITREATGAYSCDARQEVTCSPGQGLCCSEKCDATKDDTIKAALEASSTTECTSLVTSMTDYSYYNDGQLCACLTSDDFSSLSASTYDCKLDCDNSQTISAYIGADTCASDDSGNSNQPECEGYCDETQSQVIRTALLASETTECDSLTSIFQEMNGPDPTHAQICACFGSDDFSSLSSYDCKMGCQDTHTVSSYASGSGACSSSGDSDSSSNTLPIFFAFITLFFALV